MLAVLAQAAEEDTSLAVLALVVGVATPLFAFLGVVATLMFNRRHKNKMETTKTGSDAAASLSAATVAVSATVIELIAPLKDRIDQLEEFNVRLESSNAELRQEVATQAQHILENSESEKNLAEKYDLISSKYDVMASRLRLLVGYVTALRDQLHSIGDEPVPVPPDILDLFEKRGPQRGSG